jgi:ribosomal protein S2
MKLKKNLLSLKLLNFFFRFKTYYINNKIFYKKTLNSYIYGSRNNKNVINISFTIKNLKKIYILLLFFINNNNKIVFIGFPNWFNTKWKFLEIFTKKNYIFLDYNHNFSKLIKSNNNNIGLIIIYNDFLKLKELLIKYNKLNIPIIGFSIFDTNNLDYFILGKFYSKNNILFFYYFILNIYKNKKYKI